MFAVLLISTDAHGVCSWEFNIKIILPTKESIETKIRKQNKQLTNKNRSTKVTESVVNMLPRF